MPPPLPEIRHPAWQIFIGYEPREHAAFEVARKSIRDHTSLPLRVRGLVLQDLHDDGLYTRPTERRLGRLWDVISDHWMATEFAISRFLVPHLAGDGWALFADCDVMLRHDIGELFRLTQRYEARDYAVMCVHHHHEPAATEKMDGQVQARYARKNWSSVMLFNVDHPSNRKLTVELVNSVPGRDLHRFCWLEDHEIGAIGEEWNWLVGHSSPEIEPKLVHFTDGIPLMSGFETAPYADEWRNVLYSCAR